MIDADSAAVENNQTNSLNLDLEYINCSVTSLIREYLARKVIKLVLLLISSAVVSKKAFD